MSYRVESYQPAPGSGIRASLMAGVRVTDEDSGESVTIYGKSSQVSLRHKAIETLREIQGRVQ